MYFQLKWIATGIFFNHITSKTNIFFEFFVEELLSRENWLNVWGAANNPQIMAFLPRNA